MKMIRQLLAAAVITGLSAGSASAAVFTYDVNGLFSDGRVLGGSFTFDDSKPAYTQFTNLDFTISGLGTFSDIQAIGYGPNYYEVVASNLNNANRVTVAFDGSVSSSGALETVTSPLLDTIDSYYSDGRDAVYEVALSSGTITQQAALPTVAAVPEPATWGMMILGMGAVGFALRSAKRRSEKKFETKIKNITYGAVA